jgi:hypothetical protein
MPFSFRHPFVVAIFNLCILV